MKSRKIILLKNILTTCLILFLASCNIGKKESRETLKHDDESEGGTKRTEKHAATKSSGTFEEFLLKKSEVELQIYSSKTNEAYNLNEAVELRIEIYNPRHITFQTYKNTLGAGQPKPEFDNIIVGSEEHPWQENLSFFYISDNKEIPVSYAIKYPSARSELNIGQGDIGSVGIILQPGIFPSEGRLTLRLKYVELERDIDLWAETSIMLEKDHADEQQIKLSSIYYLIAIDKMEEALELSLESVQSWPESYHANVLLGEIYEENGQLEEALMAYRKGIVLFKNDQEDRIIEFPKGLWDKIHELETKLEK